MAINLLPFRTTARRKQTLKLIGAWGVSVHIGIIIVIVATSLLQQRISKQGLIIAELKQNSISLSKSYQQARQWQQAQRQQIEIDTLRKRNRQIAANHLKLLQRLPQVIPAGIQLTHLNKQDQTITLTGTTLNKNLLMHFTHDLVKHSQFKHLQALTTTHQHHTLKFTLVLSANEVTA